MPGRKVGPWAVAQAEPVAVPGRQSGALRDVECDVAVAHAQRREDVALDVLRVGLAGGPLDDQPGQDVVAVGVRKRLSGGRDQRRALQLVQGFKSGAVGRASDDGAARGRRHPGGLLKHLAHRDAVGGPLVGKLELGHVLTGGRVKVEPAGVDELHRRQRREGLRGRTEQEGSLRRRGAALAGIAEAARVGPHRSPDTTATAKPGIPERSIPSRMTRSIRASVARSGGVAAAAGEAITETRSSEATAANTQRTAPAGPALVMRARVLAGG